MPSVTPSSALLSAVVAQNFGEVLESHLLLWQLDFNHQEEKRSTLNIRPQIRFLALASFALCYLWDTIMASISTQTVIWDGVLQIETLNDLPQIVRDLESDSNLAKQFTSIEIKDKAADFSYTARTQMAIFTGLLPKFVSNSAHRYLGSSKRFNTTVSSKSSPGLALSRRAPELLYSGRRCAWHLRNSTN